MRPRTEPVVPPQLLQSGKRIYVMLDVEKSLVLRVSEGKEIDETGMIPAAISEGSPVGAPLITIAEAAKAANESTKSLFQDCIALSLRPPPHF